MPRAGVFPVGVLAHCLKQPVWRAKVAQPIALVMNMLKMSTEVGLFWNFPVVGCRGGNGR